MQPVAAALEDVEIAVVVDVDEDDAPRGAGGGGLGSAKRVSRDVRERDRRRCRVDQVGFGAGRGERFGVLPLLEIGLRVGPRVGCAAKRFEPLHRGRSALIAGSSKGHRQTVCCGRVVRLGCDRFAQKRDRLRVLTLLGVDLPEIDLGADVGRIELERFLERTDRIFGTVLCTRDEPEQVVGLRRGQPRGGGLRFGPGTVRLAAIEQGEREVEMREREVRRDLQRLLE